MSLYSFGSSSKVKHQHASGPLNNQISIHVNKLFHSPVSCKYPDFEVYHLFQTSKTDECHLCQLLSERTLIQTHSHTHTGSDQCRRIHTLLFYFWLRRHKGVSMTIHGEQGSGTFRVASQSASGFTQTFFHVTHARDSIDARDGGASVLNINRQRQQSSRGAITGWKMLKIAVVSKCIRFFTGNVDVIHVYKREVCCNMTEQETPGRYFLIK